MVRDHYNGLAGMKLGFACCPGKGGDTGTAVSAGYNCLELDAFSRKAPIFSHGCGTPVPAAGIAAGQTVLDLGSGPGLDLLLAAAGTGPAGRVVGLDMAEGMVARARAAAAAWGVKNVEVIEGLMESLPFETGSMDRVVSNCAVSLSPEKGRVFAEMSRVLRPGGRVVVADIAVSDLPAWARTNANLYTNCIAGALGKDEYLDALSRAGLSELRVLEHRTFDAPELETFLLVGTTGSGQKDPCSCSHYLAGRLLGRTAEKLRGRVGSITLSGSVPS